MIKEHILVEADYGKESVFVDIEYIELDQREINLLSEGLWFYSWLLDIPLEVKGRRQPKQWEFIINEKLDNKPLIESVAKTLIEKIKELFPDKLVEFSEENKYEVHRRTIESWRRAYQIDRLYSPTRNGRYVR